ncbi:hypothetical protein LC1Hm_3133 [Halomicrobium sp. LC1Hm]|nr:hypothetical protein LC1Hm_3133 [Halomicrobium sp. LC1Hm]
MKRTRRSQERICPVSQDQRIEGVTYYRLYICERFRHLGVAKIVTKVQPAVSVTGNPEAAIH